MAQVQYSPALKFYYDSHNFLNYEKLGNGVRCIVLLHGFGASLNTWGDIKQGLLSDDVTLYLLDLKGFGFSSKPLSHNYSIKEQSELIIAFLKAHKIDRCTLIGHSYGGAISLLTFIDIQNTKEDITIDKLILLDPGAFSDELPFFVSVLRHPITRLMLQLTTERFRAKHTLRRLFYDKTKLNAEIIYRYSYFFKAKGFNHAISNAAKNIVPIEYSAYLSHYTDIKVPVLIIWGMNDPIFSIKSAERLNKLIPSSKLVLIPECGHIPQEECPLQTLEIIKNFLHGNS